MTRQKGDRNKSVYPVEGKRKCSRCMAVLPISEFYPRNGKDHRPEDGHSSWCKECVKLNMKRKRLLKRLKEGGREKLVEWIEELKTELHEARRILIDHDSGV